MENYTKELKTVKYSAAAVKVLHFCVKPYSPCFMLHWHDRLEIIRIKKGCMMIEYCGNKYLLKAGEMTVFSPRIPHKGYTTDSYVEYDVLMFDIRSFYNETVVCIKTFPRIFDGSAKFTTAISENRTIDCVDKICNNKNLDTLEITSLIYTLLYLLTENHLTELNLEPRKRAMQIIDYIEENFALDLTTSSLSEKFGYSTEHFCRRFKEATGITPMTYLKIYRLEQALEKIKTGEQSISEIAARCGFYDANYFTRCFKAHYGFPPRHYKTKK